MEIFQEVHNTNFENPLLYDSITLLEDGRNTYKQECYVAYL